MAILVTAAVVVAGLVWVLRGQGGGDTPARIVTVAANLLPVDRRDWGRAMAAELAQIRGRVPRWRFTAGVLRVALFPPTRHRGRVLAAASAGLAATAAATAAAATAVPSLSVFAAVLGLLLCGYATMVAARASWAPATAAHMMVGAVAVAGVTAAVVTVVRAAAAHPAATTDGTHVFSILFAIILTAYLAVALTPPHLGGHRDTVLWWALGGTLASGVAAAVTAPANATGVIGILPPAAAAAVLAVSIGASAATRSRQAGLWAGLLTAALGAPINFGIDLTAILQLHHYVLTTPYDVAAYVHSGYPDVASYLLSDSIAGGILSGLVLYPLALIGLALLGAAAGTSLHRLATRRTAT
jgi:hypothetical protein